MSKRRRRSLRIEGGRLLLAVELGRGRRTELGVDLTRVGEAVAIEATKRATRYIQQNPTRSALATILAGALIGPGDPH